MADPGGERAIRSALGEIAARIGGRAEETLLLENDRKHAREVRDILAAGRDVVDLGGGLGINLLVLRAVGHTGRLVLVDRFEEYQEGNPMGPRERAIPLLREAEIEIVEMDFWPDCALPFDPGSFDVATCHDVVEHFPGHPLRQLRELRRVLRPGGTCLLSAPNGASLMKRIKLALGRQPYSAYESWMGEQYFGHFREYFRDEYEDLLVRAGFTQVRSEMAADVTVSRASNAYHDRRRSRLSPTALALIVAAATETLAPPLRHTVYARGVVPRAG